jgi:opacity protein-like surface antigen
MHPSRVFVSGIAALLLAASAGALEGQSPLSFSVSGGATVPSGGFADRVNAGYNVGASLGLHIPLFPISVRADGMFNRLEYNDAGGLSGGARYRAVTEYAQIWSGTVNAVVSMSTLLSPYLIGGIGWYRTSEADIGANLSRSENSVGGDIGAGLKLGLAGFGVYAEARYHWIGDPDVRIVPISVGVSF